MQERKVRVTCQRLEPYQHTATATATATPTHSWIESYFTHHMHQVCLRVFPNGGMEWLRFSVGPVVVHKYKSFLEALTQGTQASNVNLHCFTFDTTILQEAPWLSNFCRNGLLPLPHTRFHIFRYVKGHTITDIGVCYERPTHSCTVQITGTHPCTEMSGIALVRHALGHVPVIKTDCIVPPVHSDMILAGATCLGSYVLPDYFSIRLGLI